MFGTKPTEELEQQLAQCESDGEAMAKQIENLEAERDKARAAWTSACNALEASHCERDKLKAELAALKAAKAEAGGE